MESTFNKLYNYMVNNSFIDLQEDEYIGFFKFINYLQIKIPEFFKINFKNINNDDVKIIVNELMDNKYYEFVNKLSKQNSYARYIFCEYIIKNKINKCFGYLDYPNYYYDQQYDFYYDINNSNEIETDDHYIIIINKFTATINKYKYGIEIYHTINEIKYKCDSNGNQKPLCKYHKHTNTQINYNDVAKNKLAAFKMHQIYRHNNYHIDGVSYYCGCSNCKEHKPSKKVFLKDEDLLKIFIFRKQ